MRCKNASTDFDKNEDQRLKEDDELVEINYAGEGKNGANTSVRRCLKLGSVVATTGALEAVPSGDIRSALDRHVRGDWGDLGDDDKRENDFAFGRTLRILSAYHSASGVKFWIITEADRSATTVLLPEEY